MLDRTSKMPRKSLTAILFLVLSSSVVFCGLRLPGEYSGVVIYDQWDTCYLYNGVSLMYISNQVKERLRKYEGQSIGIDAREVYQPSNPGDGLIKEFQLLRVIEDTSDSPHAGLKLTVIPAFDIDCSPNFIIEVKNTGKRKLMIPKWVIAPTLLGEKFTDFLSPSDGKSEACITGWSLPYANGEAMTVTSTKPTPNGQAITIHKSFGLKIDDGKVPFDYLTLSAGDSARFNASLSVSPGAYDFLCGYTPGDDNRVSNIVSFVVDEHGIASMTCDWRIGPN